MLQLYNTLTKKKEEFKPINPQNVKIYSCGPTVYSNQHIGNMRAAIFQDTIRRTLKYLGYNVTSVQNITDVGHLTSDEDDGEDKMEKAAKKENKNPLELAQHYTKIYLNDLKRLNIELPTFMPKATEEIPEQIEIIQTLLNKQIAYTTSDGIYFDVSKFPQYGQLSGQTLEQKQENTQERIQQNTEKKNPQDFALWKFTVGENKNHIMRWEAPFGEGFPGWHIECSAMSAKYLGKQIDIHTGGIEHIPIHHENEIAQNTASGCVEKINYWIHNAHLQVENEKMSKSLGNVYLLQDLVNKGYNPIAFRELVLRTHYRKTLNFTFESLETGMQNIKKINEFYQTYQNLKPSQQEYDEQTQEKVRNTLQTAKFEFSQAIEDDLNTSVAMAVLYEFMNKINKLTLLNLQQIKDILELTEKFDEILGILEKTPKIISHKITQLAEQRRKSKENKDWDTADKLRNQIQELGYTIKDDKTSKLGYIISKN